MTSFTETVLAAALGGAIALAIYPALGAPPPDMQPNPSLNEWFKSLRNSKGEDCCGIADCRPYSYRAVSGRTTFTLREEGHYEILVNDEWREVPNENILYRTDNPNEAAIACIWGPPDSGPIKCFLRPSEGSLQLYRKPQS